MKTVRIRIIQKRLKTQAYLTRSTFDPTTQPMWLCEERGKKSAQVWTQVVSERQFNLEYWHWCVRAGDEQICADDEMGIEFYL